MRIERLIKLVSRCSAAVYATLSSDTRFDTVVEAVLMLAMMPDTKADTEATSNAGAAAEAMAETAFNTETTAVDVVGGCFDGHNHGSEVEVLMGLKRFCVKCDGMTYCGRESTKSRVRPNGRRRDEPQPLTSLRASRRLVVGAKLDLTVETIHNDKL